MMVAIYIRVISLRFAVPFDDMDKPDFCKRRKRSVYGIERNIRESLSYPLENIFRIGMIFRFKQFLVNRKALRRYAQIVLPEPLTALCD